MQDAGRTTGKTSSVLAKSEAAATGFGADHLHLGVFEERIEETDRIAASAHTRNESIGKTANLIERLDAHLVTDDPVKITNHHRVRMRAEGGPEQVMRGFNVGDPIAHRLAYGVFQSCAAIRDTGYFGAQQPHSKYIEALAAHVLFAHINPALEAEQGAYGCGGYAVLAGAGFSDNPMLAQASGNQYLSQAIVDLMRASMK
jgi:hypothetical protein